MSHYVDGIRTPSPPVYAVPDKSKKKRPPENGDHKPDPDQTDTGKSKGVIVNKKAKGNKKTSENIELVSQMHVIMLLLTLY